MFSYGYKNKNNKFKFPFVLFNTQVAVVCLAKQFSFRFYLSVANIKKNGIANMCNEHAKRTTTTKNRVKFDSHRKIIRRMPSNTQ